MEGGDERKKRKIDDHEGGGQHHQAEEDVSEQEKMEAFVALIRRTRETREWLAGWKQAEEENGSQLARQQVWNPKFQVEDFIDDPGKSSIKIPDASDPSGSKTKPDDGREDDDKGRRQGKDEDGGGVNLELSL